LSASRARAGGGLAHARLAVTSLAAACATLLLVGDAHAGVDWKRLSLGGSFEMQQLVRTPDASTFEFIQQRNTLRLIGDWRPIDQAIPENSGWQPSFIERLDAFVLYRGVYDSVYDALPSVPTTRDYAGNSVGPPFSNLDQLNRAQRDTFRAQNQIREAYSDILFSDHSPLLDRLMVRAGRQQIVWGVSDGYRVLDRINSLDLTWHQYQDLPPRDDSFDEIRVPSWMLLVRKELQNDIRSIQGLFFEAYWNPGDWNPNKIGFLPTPWGAQLVNPLVNQAPGQARLQDNGQAQLQNGTTLRQGNYDRNPAENSQVGVRIGRDRETCDQLVDCKLQGSLVYLHHRFTPWGGSSTSAASLVNVLSDRRRSNRSLPLEFDAPYVNTVGGAFSWTPTLDRPFDYPIEDRGRGVNPGFFDERFRDWSLRGETTFDFGVPFYERTRDWEKAAKINSGKDTFTTDLVQPFLPPTRSRDLWSGVFGADYSNTRYGRLVGSLQFFWSNLLQLDGRTLGSLDLPPSLFKHSPADGFGDRVHRWEVLTTASVGYWLDGGRVRLGMIHLLDWVNSYSQEVAWSAEYRVMPGLAAELSQRLLINPSHEVNFEPWALAGLNRGRSEIGLRLRYDFPTYNVF
jgi:hypothetical protein